MIKIQVLTEEKVLIGKKEKLTLTPLSYLIDSGILLKTEVKSKIQKFIKSLSEKDIEKTEVVVGNRYEIMQDSFKKVVLAFARITEGLTKNEEEKIAKKVGVNWLEIFPDWKREMVTIYSKEDLSFLQIQNICDFALNIIVDKVFKIS